MTNEPAHRWNTKEFEERTRQLYRTELHKLYPSESWALYRIMPQCKTVIDLGCGNGAMASIVHQISPDTHYTGMDHQATLMAEAKEAFPYADFAAGDLMTYLDDSPSPDCVMSWSVIKSFENWREVVAKMIAKATRYVIFDMRVGNLDQEIFDDKVCWAQYGDIRGAHALINYNHLKDAVLSDADHLARYEVAGYQSRYGKNVQFTIEQPDLFLVTFVLTKRQPGDEGECLVYEQLPANLER
ncbi:MAG: class I SAM-dependent methyltransferase [Rhodospirillales bacterium]